MRGAGAEGTMVWSVARRADPASGAVGRLAAEESVSGVRIGRTVCLGGCVGAGRGGFPGVETLLDILGGHFDGESGLANEAKLGGEIDRSACGAGQGEEKHLVLHSVDCRSGLQLIPDVGSPERRPRGRGAEVTGVHMMFHCCNTRSL